MTLSSRILEISKSQNNRDIVKVMPLRQQVVQEVARLFGTLGHPTRLRILRALHHGERDVGSLREELGVTPANLSQHLAALRAHHLLAVRREGTHLHYSIRDRRVADLLNLALDVLAEDVAHAGEIKRAIERVRLRE